MIGRRVKMIYDSVNGETRERIGTVVAADTSGMMVQIEDGSLVHWAVAGGRAWSGDARYYLLPEEQPADFPGLCGSKLGVHVCVKERGHEGNHAGDAGRLAWGDGDPVEEHLGGRR